MRLLQTSLIQLFLLPQVSLIGRTNPRASCTSSNDSYLAMEDKKQLSERREMINMSHDVGFSSQGNTLGKMLAMPDQETRPVNSNYKVDKHGQNKQFNLDSGNADMDSPYGISSRDGWKDVCVRNLQRFRALPVTSIGVRSSKYKTGKGVFQNDFSLKLQEAVTYGRNEPRKLNFSRKGDLKPRDSSFRCEKYQSLSCIDSHLARGNQVIPDEKLKNSFEDNNVSEDGVVPNLSDNTAGSANKAAEVVEIAETENVRLSSGSFEELLSDASVGQESSFQSPKEALASSNCPKVDPEFHMSSGEDYSHSPNSVLELPFQEELSYGSECFEGVSADLHGLRMQLQLLKSESDEASSEGHGMAVSSDEDNEEGSLDLSEENSKFTGMFLSEESRDFSYVIDVLDEAGFHGENLEMDFEAWHSPECPLSPSVFERLEKKYGDQKSWKKSERRLLFDRLNMGLMEILRPCTDMNPWLTPLRNKFYLPRTREMVEEELWTILVNEEKEVWKDLSAKVSGGESRCVRLGDHIEVIGREIGNILFDELVAELASIECF